MPTVRHLAECCLGRHADSVAHQSTPQLSTRLQLQHPRQLQRCHSRLTLRTHFAVVSPSRCMPSQFTLSPLRADQRLPGMDGLDQATVIVPARVGPAPPAASLKVTPQICQLFCFYRCLTSQSTTMTRPRKPKNGVREPRKESNASNAGPGADSSSTGAFNHRATDSEPLSV